MTKEDIIRMAREAEIGDSHGYIIANELAHLERFAALVAAAERRGCERHFQVAMRNAVTAEREACAKVCEELAELNRTSPTDSMWEQEECAAAIRARGETK